MSSYLLAGATLAFAAAVQPGPFQAFLVSSTMTSGWRRTIPAAFAPILSDIPIVSLVLFVLTHVSPAWLDGLRLAGGLFLLYLAARAFLVWRRYRQVVSTVQPSARRTFFEAVGVNLLNPNPYISWSLVLGPLVLKAWREAPGYGVALVVAFYATMIGSTAALVLLLAAARSLGPRVARASVGVSAIALAFFGLYQVVAGLR